MAKDLLQLYKSKRNFDVTPEPAEGGESEPGQLSFVIQKHWATRLHYDFRLELDGTMKSWAVPKGPSFDPADKRMAVPTEDHPISYNSFEGTIPEKQYGAGKVIIWDKGTWEPVGDARKALREGKLKFILHGHKLRGHWTLVRMHGRDGGKAPPWLLIKEKDEHVRPASEFSVVDEMPDSVASLGMPGRAKPARAAAARAPAARKNGMPAGARKAALPATLKPQLATLVDAAPPDPAEWLFEIKFDGYRLVTRVDGRGVKCFTRNGNDWTHKLGPLAKALKAAKLPPGWYDGEIVVNGERGVPDFQALQNAFDSQRTSGIVYYLFDAPYLGGYDLREVPVEERKALLRAALSRNRDDSIRFSEEFGDDLESVVASACKIGLEGVIGKRRGSGYVQKRSGQWIKLKCGQRQEFVIGGYTPPAGSRKAFGSLLLGIHGTDGKLHYAGNVGTGFSEKTLEELKEKMDALAAEKSPFAEKTDNDRRAHWVRPRLVAEVAFGEWTREGRIRHSVFHGLRSDKKPEAITREEAKHVDTKKKEKKGSGSEAASRQEGGQANDPTNDQARGRLPKSLRVTSPTRVIDASTGATKLDLIRYYALVAPLMLPHLKGRPVAFVRAPSGIKGELFFQKHGDVDKMPGVRQLDPALYMGHEPLLEVATSGGLLSAAQMNVVEFHTWNAVKSLIHKPDRMTFDLDPGEGVGWPEVQEATVLMRVALEELGLPAFLKTSGGKGLHVVVPLRRLHDWDTVKDFSEAVVQHMARTIPQRFVAKSGPKNRVGKIFIDYLRNGWGATTVAAWSARARPGLGISVPVRWDELPSLKGGAHWTIRTVHERLDAGNSPWDGYAAAAKPLTAALKMLQ